MNLDYWSVPAPDTNAYPIGRLPFPVNPRLVLSTRQHSGTVEAFGKKASFIGLSVTIKLGLMSIIALHYTMNTLIFLAQLQI